MITIKNLLNQPQTVDGKSLAVDGELEVKSVTEEIQRLVDKGFVAIVKSKPTTPPATGGQGGTAK